MKNLFTLFVLSLSFLFHSETFCQNTWTAIATQAPDSSGSLMLLLSDGSVLCKTNYGGGDRIGNQWNKLTPNSSGSYINGTWSKVAPMKDTRLYFSSQLLKNGNVYLAGGEYGTGITLGEIYDPVSNSWTQLPNTNNVLSDACSALLPDGRVLQGSLASPGNKTLIFNPNTNTFSNGPNCLGGHNESTWLKLQDNSILFVDIGSTSAERYIPSLNQWVADANAPTNLYDPYGFETGPGFLLPDGRAFFIGSLGNTAYYTPSGTNSPGTWSVGPTVPNNHGMPDAPGSMMVDGKIIFAAGPKPIGSGAANIFIAPTYFYEFDYLTNTITPITAPGGGQTVADTAFNSNMLTLPDGSVMYSRLMQKTYYVRQPNGAPLAAGKPTITSVAQNGCTNSFTLTGLLFNGICEGSCYGDDWQMNTNFPIVRLSAGTNVYYARTYNWNHNGVRNYTQADTTLFQLPPNLPSGTYSLSVIANGNASSPITFTFSNFPSLTSARLAPDICTGATFSYSPTTNLPNTTLLWTRAAVAGLSNPAITIPQTTNPNETLINTSNLSKTAVYAYTLSNGACVTNYSVSVVVHPATSGTISGNNSVCANSSSTLTIKGITNYTWSTGAQTKSVVVTPSATTIYTVNGITYNGCAISQQYTVNVKPTPTIGLAGSYSMCVGEALILNANSNGINFYWNTGEVNYSISISPTTSTNYTLTATAQNGCSHSATTSISVLPCTGLYELAANTSAIKLHPNPARENITIGFYNNQKELIDLKIYNDFGQLVREETINANEGNNLYLADVANYDKGVYLILLYTESGVQKSRWIKE